MSTSFASTLASLSVNEVARQSLGSDNLDIQSAQTEHRLNILTAWSNDEKTFELGDQILDIGCGQGDNTAAVAAVCKQLGHGKVTGLDPAPLDYGSPWTLGQAQAHLLSGGLSPFLEFVQAETPTYVQSVPDATFSTAMLVHSLYYVPTASTLLGIFKALRTAGVQQLLLAEWSLSISAQEAMPHLLAVLLQSVHPKALGNVRTVLSPADIVSVAEQAGWQLERQKLITPGPGLKDGEWETQGAMSIAAKHVFDVGSDERSEAEIKRASVRAHGEALVAAVKALPEGKAKGVRCMDVWTGVLRPAP